MLSGMARVDEVFQPAVEIFYLKDCSHKDIADMLNVAVGEVKSRSSGESCCRIALWQHAVAQSGAKVALASRNYSAIAES